MARALRAKVKQQYVTTTGLASLKQQLIKLKQDRAAIMEEMHELILQSSANNGLEDSMRALHQDRAIELSSQISRLEYIISTAKVIKRPASSASVQIGSKVTLDAAGAQRTYMIVGSIEADPDQGKISDESPLGKCLLGKKINDRLEVVCLAGNKFAGIIVAIR
jgi:transcription elongation factor GreA